LLAAPRSLLLVGSWQPVAARPSSPWMTARPLSPVLAAHRSLSLVGSWPPMVVHRLPSLLAAQPPLSLAASWP
jgi:hypothetical protein